jgi:hypothetical protein
VKRRRKLQPLPGAGRVVLANVTGTSVQDLDGAPVDVALEAITPGSFDAIRQQVRAALAERAEAAAGGDVWLYVCDIGPSWVVYEAGYDCMWRCDYSIADGVVTLGAPTEVKAITTYEPATDDPAAPAPAMADMVESTGRAGERTTGHVERIEGRLLAALGTDADGGRIFEVQIIAYGDSKNGRRYPESVLRPAAPMYEGAPAYDHHRTDVELNTGTVVGIVGHYRNVQATETGLLAELHLLPSAQHVAELLDQTLENQSAGLPLLVGISHDVMTASKPISVNGRAMREVTAVLGVNSADVVVTPAAGGMATRMVAGGAGPTTNPPNITNPEGNHPMNLKQLLALLRAAESAERAALLEQHAHVIESAGLTAADFTRMAEHVVPDQTPAPVVTPDHVVETALVNGSALGTVIVERVLASAQLPVTLAASIVAELPAKFTEADVVAKVQSHKRLLEAHELAGLAPTVQHSVESTRDSVDKKVAALDAMLAGDFRNGYRSFKEAYIDFTGRQPRWNDASDFNREVLRESASFVRNGERVGFDAAERSAESATSATWALALGDSITRRTVAEYMLPALQSWRDVVSSIVPVNDFRTQRIERIGGYGTLPIVAQGAPYQQLTTPGNDTEPTYAIAKRGGTEDLTLEAIANDDLRIIAQIPSKLGRAAAQTLYRFVWDFFSTNPTIYDGTALFAAGHNNTATTALSGANLSAARKAMRKQTAYGNSVELLSAVPKMLVTCSDLEELAFQLCTSPGAVPTGAPAGGATDIPNIHQGVKPIVVDYWSSSTAWFVVADPSQIPTLELGFYQGKEDPELFVQADPASGSYFAADKVTYKIRHTYSGAWLDFRSVQRGNA